MGKTRGESTCRSRGAGFNGTPFDGNNNPDKRAGRHDQPLETNEKSSGAGGAMSK